MERALFLDRDGTLIDLVPYLKRPEDVRLVPGAAEALRRMRERGWLRVLVTNQSGIARGYFGPEDVEAVHARLLELLRARGADLEAIEICPHGPDAMPPCDCRKPAPGMLRRAAERLSIDGARSWAIGDRFEDLEAGAAIGARGVLVRTGYGQGEMEKAASEGRRFDGPVARDLPAACAYIEREVEREESAKDSSR